MKNRIEEWSNAIRVHEGWILPNVQYPKGSRSYRNNNPGNLRYTKYTASLGENFGFDDKNFIRYKTYDIGFNALMQFLKDACNDELRSYKGEMNLLDFYKVYAPSSDGNYPAGYAKFIAGRLGVPVETKIKALLGSEGENPPEGEISPYRAFSQTDQKWSGIIIGKTTINGKIKYYTIGSDGCFICCLAMKKGIPPNEVFEILKKGGGITGGGLIVSEKAAQLLGFQYLGKDMNINNMPTIPITIKEVNYIRTIAQKIYYRLRGITFLQHFVLRVVKNDGSRVIIDPLGGAERPINYYPFKSYRIFK